MDAPSPIRLRILDALRGLAALYVVVGHARYLLHEGFATGYRLHPGDYSLWQKMAVHALTLFGWGHEAVILFFVLSGFAIHLRFAREQAELGSKAPFHPGTYFRRRIKRLYPPLLLALALTFGLDALGAHFRLPIHPMVGPVTHDAPTLLGNLAFAMDNWGQAPFACFGTDKPLWSLRYEAAFYLFYPLLWLLNRRSAWLAMAATLTMALLLAWMPAHGASSLDLLRKPLELLFVWWLGGFLAEVFTGRVRLPMKGLAVLALCLPFGLRRPGTEVAFAPKPYDMWLLGLGFFGLMAACLAWHPILDRSRLTGFFAKLGDCSYTLYVIHMPILVLLGGWLMSRTSDGEPPCSLLWVLPGVALCVTLAWLMHFIVETPFTGGGKKAVKKQS